MDKHDKAIVEIRKLRENLKKQRNEKLERNTRRRQ